MVERLSSMTKVVGVIPSTGHNQVCWHALAILRREGRRIAKSRTSLAIEFGVSLGYPVAKVSDLTKQWDVISLALVVRF